MRVDERERRTRAPVPEQPVLEMRGGERFAQQRVVLQVDHAQRQVLGRAPVRVDGRQLRGIDSGAPATVARAGPNAESSGGVVEAGAVGLMRGFQGRSRRAGRRCARVANIPTLCAPRYDYGSFQSADHRLRTIVLVAQDRDAGRAERQESARRRGRGRPSEPPARAGCGRSRTAARCPRRAHARDHAIRTRAGIGCRLAVGTPVAKEIPARTHGPDVGRALAFVRAVVPLDEIGVGDGLAAKPASAHVRAARCSGLVNTAANAMPCSRAAERRGLPLAVGGQRQVGQAGVLPGQAPCRFAMAGEVNHGQRFAHVDRDLRVIGLGACATTRPRGRCAKLPQNGRWQTQTSPRPAHARTESRQGDSMTDDAHASAPRDRGRHPAGHGMVASARDGARRRHPGRRAVRLRPGRDLGRARRHQEAVRPVRLPHRDGHELGHAGRAGGIARGRRPRRPARPQEDHPDRRRAVRRGRTRGVGRTRCRRRWSAGASWWASASASRPWRHRSTRRRSRRRGIADASCRRTSSRSRSASSCRTSSTPRWRSNRRGG